MRSHILISLAVAAGLGFGAARAQTVDFSGGWSPPFAVHSSGLPLMAGMTQWTALSKGDPAKQKVPTVAELSARADESVRTHHGVPIFGMIQPDPPPFTPEGQKAFGAVDQKALSEKELACYPSNLLMRVGALTQIVQGRGAVSFLYEAGLGRVVFLDGRSEADPVPMWSGHSVGRLDGGVLKVKTTAIRGDVFGFQGWPMDDKAILEEVYTLSPDRQHMTLRETFSDPTYYREPLTRMVYYDRSKEELTDFTCTEGKDDMIETVSKAPPAPVN